jgi:predicted MFS family arabinose efflux permease
MSAGLSRGRRWSLALVATATMSVSYVDRQALAVLAPTVTAALSIDDAHYGALASAFSIAYLVGAPLAGRAVDRFGARVALPFAVLVWSLVAGAHSLAAGFASLFLLRILLGLAEAPSFPGAAQTVHRALAPADRPRGFGVLFMGSSIGSVIAPPLATFLLVRFHSWRAAFVGTAIVGLAWVPIWIHLTGRPEARALLAHRGNEPEPATTRRDLAGLVTSAPVVRAMAMVLAMAPIMAFALLWGSKLLVARYGVPQASVGRWLWAPPLIYDLGSYVCGHLVAGRPSRARPLVGAALIAATTMALLPLATTPLAAIIVISIALAGVGGAFALLTSEMLASVPRERVSTAAGITAAAQSIAYVVSSPLVGVSVQRTHGYALAAVVLAAWSAPGTLYWILARGSVESGQVAEPK